MPYMGQQDSGYAVVGLDGIHLNTVATSRKASITNWLLHNAKIPLSSNASDDYVEMAWREHSLEHKVALCEVEVRVLNHGI